MAFCINCGAQVKENTIYCHYCGARIYNNTNPYEEMYGSAEEKHFDKESENVGFDEQYIPPQYDAEDIAKHKIWAVLAYFGMLGLVSLIKINESPYVKFHCNQGVVLFLSSFVIQTVFGIIVMIAYVGMILITALTGSSVALVVTLILMMLFILVYNVVAIALFVIMILGIINAATGKTKELPFIGKHRIIK